MKKFGKFIGWTAMSAVPLLISIVLQLLIGFALSFIIAFIASFRYGMNNKGPVDPIAVNAYMTDMLSSSMGAIVLIYQLIALVVFGLWYYFGTGKPRPQIVSPKKVFCIKNVFATIILGFGMCLAANAFMLLSQYIMPDAFEAYVEMVESAGLGTDPFTIVASVIFAPIGEEILCRGLIYHYGRKAVADMKNRTLAFWIANTIQALMFGIMHMNLIQGLYAFFLGLGIGWLRERYHSLYPCMLVHFVVNFTSTFLVEYLLGWMPETIAYLVPLLIISLIICAVSVVIELAWKKVTPPTENSTEA